MLSSSFWCTSCPCRSADLKFCKNSHSLGPCFPCASRSIDSSKAPMSAWDLHCWVFSLMSTDHSHPTINANLLASTGNSWLKVQLHRHENSWGSLHARQGILSQGTFHKLCQACGQKFTCLHADQQNLEEGLSSDFSNGFDKALYKVKASTLSTQKVEKFSRFPTSKACSLQVLDGEDFGRWAHRGNKSFLQRL